MRYPSTVNLPFNHGAITDGFLPILPGAAPPAGDGYWLIVQGGTLVVASDAGLLQLPFGPPPGFLPETAAPFCIGTWQGQPLRVAAISRSVAIPDMFAAEAFNAAGDRLDDGTLTLGGWMRSNWRMPAGSAALHSRRGCRQGEVSPAG